MHVEYASFPDRSLRTQYIASRFAAVLKGKALDVGCDKAVLKKLRPDLDYLGIDVGGEPDMVVDLEKIDRLPFETGQFDCVICADVLEHIENIHFILGELVRVTRGSVILSLPNNWANARVPVGRGRGHIGHYGLPPERPQDRHKWFFCLSEAVAFLEAQQAKHPMRIREMFAMEKPRFPLFRALRRLTSRSQEAYLNRFAHTLWAALEKTR